MTFRAESIRPAGDGAATPLSLPSAYRPHQAAAPMAWTELRSGPMIGCPTRRLLASSASRSQGRPAGVPAPASATPEVP